MDCKTVIFLVCCLCFKHDCTAAKSDNGDSGSLNWIQSVLEDLEKSIKEQSIAREKEDQQLIKLTEEKIKRNEAIKKRLEQLEHSVALLENYVSGERETDLTLQDLTGKTKSLFEGYMNTIKEMTKSMKEEVRQTLLAPESTLTDVETSANERNVVIGGILYYGGIGSACAWADLCRTPRSECRRNICQCLPGLSSDLLRQDCVETCDNGYGHTYQTVHNYAIHGYNDLVLENVTLDQCKDRCENVKDFVCRSFDYYPDWHSCYLSASVKGDTERGELDEYDDQVGEVGEKDGWRYNSAGVYFQRDCIVDATDKEGDL